VVEIRRLLTDIGLPSIIFPWARIRDPGLENFNKFRQLFAFDQHVDH
jgi:hypothetical protein